MLRRLIIAWLIVSILGYGMALAADAHNEQSTDHTHEIGDNTTHPADASDSDHCCHGGIHLLGLTQAEAIKLSADQGIFWTPYPVSRASSPPAFLFRPPISA
ncbi:MAG: hypothetical protein DIZ77_00800 [endosymbiont of Seepiophila jonesi]|uniref:DUF2946 domain-containing protein n=1 Tax=endosymbiont of Lamellibrachia luymesi TaxID=2200907 RepID=A0A370DZS7_9GAMM|nr:MAG: hypothetical protein DIZ79_03505 [endosymbiont of Lamellibrachia luymesi]RDH94509.1 MAG: hypothetical protein DIZ77_00800 [endosymbiont of Seepiophila jonesi]